jgi:hypothetical protein
MSKSTRRTDDAASASRAVVLGDEALGGPCVGSLTGKPCVHGSDGRPAPAVIVEDGRAMCADHRRGFRMRRTNAA